MGTRIESRLSSPTFRCRWENKLLRAIRAVLQGPAVVGGVPSGKDPTQLSSQLAEWSLRVLLLLESFNISKFLLMVGEVRLDPKPADELGSVVIHVLLTGLGA